MALCDLRLLWLLLAHLAVEAVELMQVEVQLYNDAVPRGRERESETRPSWAVLFALLRGVCSPSDRAEVQRGGDFQLLPLAL